jgi:hypothetical protein
MYLKKGGGDNGSE